MSIACTIPPAARSWVGDRQIVGSRTVGAGRSRPPHLGEFGTVEVGAGEIGAFQVSPGEIDSTQVCTAKPRIAKIGISEGGKLFSVGRIGRPGEDDETDGDDNRAGEEPGHETPLEVASERDVVGDLGDQRSSTVQQSKPVVILPDPRGSVLS
jgi:hypothetical protein